MASSGRSSQGLSKREEGFLERAHDEEKWEVSLNQLLVEGKTKRRAPLPADSITVKVFGYFPFTVGLIE